MRGASRNKLLQSQGGIMQLGNIQVRVISDGSYLLDGGLVYGQIPKVVWEKDSKPDRKNRVRLGLNCLLIQTPDRNILIDTGVGARHPERNKELYGLSSSKLLRNLRANGLTVRDIDTVVLTCLHFDHAGGITRLDRQGNVIPTFPNAIIMVQRSAFERLQAPNERTIVSTGYTAKEDFELIEGNEKLLLLDGDTEIAPGINTVVTDGPADGHQSVLIDLGSEKIAYLSDLVPTPSHVNLPYITAYDRRPDATLEQKRRFLNRIEAEGWLMVFSHGYTHVAAYLERRKDQLCLRPVPTV
jgi:glyoxylase-like metal-dependent hydrolase (beta-lactamase superfamily II)